MLADCLLDVTTWKSLVELGVVADEGGRKRKDVWILLRRQWDDCAQRVKVPLLGHTNIKRAENGEINGGIYEVKGKFLNSIMM